MIPEDVINKIRKDAFDRKHVIPQSQFIEVAEYGFSLATEQLQELEKIKSGKIVLVPLESYNHNSEVYKKQAEQLQASKKEIERLKGLVKEQFWARMYNAGVEKDNIIEPHWQQFKTENNLL